MIMAIKYDNCKDCHSRCVHAGKDREFICINGVSCKITKEKPKTNADRIRAMSDEELAKFLECFGLCHHCTEHHRLGNVRFYQDEKCDEQCEQHCLEWLKQPAEDDNVPADQ
jgi:hypothetical protein